MTGTSAIESVAADGPPVSLSPEGRAGSALVVRSQTATRPRMSLRGLAGLAVLLAGLAIAAQALFIPAKALAGQALLSQAWDRTLLTGSPSRPWPWADFTPAAQIIFPAQNAAVLALTDASGESLAFGPTHMAASVQPGERGVSVFAAHRDTHFALLSDVKAGDPILVETRDGPRHFRVTGTEVVHWNASGIRPDDGGAPRIALVTCWPLDAAVQGELRYVVWAEIAE